VGLIARSFIDGKFIGRSTAGIDGVGEHMVDGGVARLDPADAAALVQLQREFEPFRAEPAGAATALGANHDPAVAFADGLAIMGFSTKLWS